MVLILHLVEEVRAGFRTLFPLGEMPLRVFVGLNGLLYAFCFVTLVLSAAGHAWASALAGLLAVGMLLNGLGHLGAVVVRRSYFPGGWTAAPLALAALHVLWLLLD